MASTNTKRVIAAGCGLVFSVIYGFWTMLLTGGGHGNFIWFVMFLTAGLFGMYYPIMAAVAVDLRSVWSKAVFGALIAINFIISTGLLYGWVTEAGENGRPSDFEKMSQLSGVGSIVLFGIIHFLPTVIFLIFLIWSIRYGSSVIGEEFTVLDLS